MNLCAQDEDSIAMGDNCLWLGISVDIREEVIRCMLQTIEPDANQPLFEQELEKLLKSLSNALFWDLDLPEV